MAQVQLSEEELVQLNALERRLGTVRAAKELLITYPTLLRALCGRGVRPSTVVCIQARLRAIAAEAEAEAQ